MALAERDKYAEFYAARQIFNTEIVDDLETDLGRGFLPATSAIQAPKIGKIRVASGQTFKIELDLGGEPISTPIIDEPNEVQTLQPEGETKTHPAEEQKERSWELAAWLLTDCTENHGSEALKVALSKVPTLAEISALEEWQYFYTKAKEASFALTKRAVAKSIASNTAIKQNIRGESEFRVSDDMVSVWIEAQRVLAIEAGGKPNPMPSGQDLKVVKQEMLRSLHKVVDFIAEYKRYDTKRARVTFGGDFLPFVSTLIAEHLLLPVRQAPLFMDALLKEIYMQSKENSVFFGEWGQLVIDDADDELLLELKPMKQIRLKNRSRK